MAWSVAAEAPEPTGTHPRIWLDEATEASLQTLARREGNTVYRAVQRCAMASRNEPNAYMGWNWANNASTCALAYRATGDKDYAKTSLIYFEALLDDWKKLGDNAGGDDVVRHDSGYAMRTFAPHAALVYDWLHDAPGMTEELRARARARFKAWLQWFAKDGYRADVPGTNYHAGYLMGATLIAIAQGSEAGDYGAQLWAHVRDTMWADQMRSEASEGGALIGGDWGEGWQYGPLAVVEYSLAARAMKEHGVSFPEIDAWAEALFLRYVHALTPDGRATFTGGDTQVEKPYIDPTALPMIAVIAGPAPEHARRWAQAELDASGRFIKSEDPLVFQALADARQVPPVPYPAHERPTYYFASGTNAYYTRSSWSPRAIWSVMECAWKRKMDHLHPNEGNIALSRGADHLIVDPSPYGSFSTLTGNAPTAETQLFPEYQIPSQGDWSRTTGYAWTRHTASAITAARCDYADEYRFESTPSDVPLAVRDFVVVPYGDSATAIVVDQASTGDLNRGFHLRFRSPAKLTLDGPDLASGKLGKSSLTIRTVHVTNGAATVHSITENACKGLRGKCRAARFPVHEYRLEVRGPDMLAIHVIDAAARGASLSRPRLTEGEGAKVVELERGERRIAVVVAQQPEFKYRAAVSPATSHIILGAPKRAEVSTEMYGGNCLVEITAGDAYEGQPLILSMDSECNVTEDPLMTRPLPGPGGDSKPRLVGIRLARGGGCCGGNGAQSQAMVLGAIVLLVLRRRRSSGGR